MHGERIALATIATTSDTDVAILSILIPREEVHSDELYTHLLVMLEEAIDILLATGILGYSPREIHVLGSRMRQLVLILAIIEEVVEGIFRAFYLGFSWTMNPERIVIDTQFQALRLTLGCNVLKSLRTIMGHITALILGKHWDETIRTNHVIA